MDAGCPSRPVGDSWPAGGLVGTLEMSSSCLARWARQWTQL